MWHLIRQSGLDSTRQTMRPQRQSLETASRQEDLQSLGATGTWDCICLCKCICKLETKALMTKQLIAKYKKTVQNCYGHVVWHVVIGHQTWCARAKNRYLLLPSKPLLRPFNSTISQFCPPARLQCAGPFPRQGPQSAENAETGLCITAKLHVSAPQTQRQPKQIQKSHSRSSFIHSQATRWVQTRH